MVDKFYEPIEELIEYIVKWWGERRLRKKILFYKEKSLNEKGQ